MQDPESPRAPYVRVLLAERDRGLAGAGVLRQPIQSETSFCFSCRYSIDFF